MWLQSASVLTVLAFNLSAVAAPNIVFILVDDLGYGDVGFNGSSWYETPALDALGRESLVFDNAYMYPTCSPSRAALFTGKQSFRTGVYTVPVLERGNANQNVFSRWTIESQHKFYSQPLATAGYKSIHLGKWHVVGPYATDELRLKHPFETKLTQPRPGDYSWVAQHRSAEMRPFYPEGRGFLENVGGTFRGDPAFEKGGYNSEAGGYWAPFSNPFIEPKQDDGWLTDRLTDEAIDFIDQHEDGPFLINLHCYAVHRPIRTRSEASYDNYMKKDGDPETGQGIGPARERMARYATVVEALDANVGRLVRHLDAKALRNNTLIVFSSDNGHHPMFSRNNRLRGAKGEIYEGGIRVPLLINWPGKVMPRRCSAPVSALDMFPTFLEVAGVRDYAGVLDGHSLVELFQQDSEALNERSLSWHIASRWKHGACSAIRKGPYKLIQFLKNGRLELYDLDQDPKEENNLAKTEVKVASRLLDDLIVWRRDNQVPLPPESKLPH